MSKIVDIIETILSPRWAETIITAISKIVMRPCLGGHVKRYTPSVRPSVRLSVCPVPTVYWKSKNRRYFKFGGDDPGHE